MPYIVRPGRLPARALAACGLFLALGAGTAQAEITSPSECTANALTQPFLPFGDTHYYTPVPGEAWDSFGAQGWTLSGGASAKSTKLMDGSTGLVLDLPSGSKAISPNFCVTSEYPTARTEVRDVAGSQGVYLNVAYMGTATQNKPKNTGQMHGNNTEWTLATPVNIQPENVSGWQVLRVVLVPGGTKSDFQLSNLYIDPYKR